jgi:hypothetical protein
LGFKIISTIAPYAKIDGALPHVYTQSINKDFMENGIITGKPKKGFPTF